MREVTGNIWAIEADYRVITTNGVVKKNGDAVMGRGIALTARLNHPGIEKMLGSLITNFQNHVFFLPYNLIAFPTKHHWRDSSDLALIEQSARELSAFEVFRNPTKPKTVLLPEPGCQNGGLDWKDVKPILEKYLDDQFIVVHRTEK